MTRPASGKSASQRAVAKHAAEADQAKPRGQVDSLEEPRSRRRPDEAAALSTQNQLKLQVPIPSKSRVSPAE